MNQTLLLHVRNDNVQKARSTSSGDQEHHNIATKRPGHKIKPPIKYDFEDMVFYSLIRNFTIFQKIMHNQEKSRWMDVIVEEMESLDKNQA